MGVTGELRTGCTAAARAIGRVTLEHGVVLAPMAGVCNLPFRFSKEQGAA